eukprot:IDg10941t1
MLRGLLRIRSSLNSIRSICLGENAITWKSIPSSTKSNNISCYGDIQSRSVILTILDITEYEKQEKFFEVLKDELRIEVLKSNSSTLKIAARVALRVDGAIWSASDPSRLRGRKASTSAASTHAPIEIRSLEAKRKREAQHRKYRENNACFTCHKVICRPYKQSEGTEANNAETVERDTSDSDTDSEN